MNWKLVASIALLAVVWCRGLAGQVAGPRASLEGVWVAIRNFGPAVSGTITITRSDGNWRAQIAQYDEQVAIQNGRLSFELPGGQGWFGGRLERDGSLIRCHWTQPPTVNAGNKFASPVVLRPRGKDRWRGEIVPLQDDWTLYLVVSRAPDGTLAAFLRNPDRNIGVFWSVDRLEQHGQQIKLIGKLRNRGPERVLGEGLYYRDDHRISIYFPARGGTYDFVPVSDAPIPGFYARGKIPPPATSLPCLATRNP